ncbi:hypothetical protein ACFE04_006700 [Oxalis oulophora]
MDIPNNISNHSASSSAYRVVRKRKWGKWVSKIREPGTKSKIWLGSFQTPEMAAAAYDVTALYFRGCKAKLNLPELAHTLPKPVSSNPEGIQMAAHEAAIHVRTAQWGHLAAQLRMQGPLWLGCRRAKLRRLTSRLLTRRRWGCKCLKH